MKTQLQEAKKIEEDLDLQLKKRIQESERPEEEIMHLRKKFDQESIKSKFENNAKTLDDILSSQRPSRDKFGLGYDKEKKPENKRFTLSSHDKDGTNVMPRRPMTVDIRRYFLVIATLVIILVIKP